MRLSFFFKKLTLCHDMKKIYTVDKNCIEFLSHTEIKLSTYIYIYEYT